MNTVVQDRLHIPIDALSELCQRYFVRELSLFGSVLRDDFRDESDVDVLVEYEPGAPIGLFEHLELQEAIEQLIGRRVDLISKRGLNLTIRDEIVASSHILYGP